MGRGGRAVPRARGTGAGDHLPRRDRRSSEDARDQRTDIDDPRLRARGVVRRLRALEHDRPSRRQGPARRGRAIRRLGGWDRVPRHHQGWADRLAPRSLPAHHRRRGGPAVLAGRAGRRDRPPSRARAPTRARQRARAEPPPVRDRRSEVARDPGRLPRHPDTSRGDLGPRGDARTQSRRDVSGRRSRPVIPDRAQLAAPRPDRDRPAGSRPTRAEGVRGALAAGRPLAR